MHILGQEKRIWKVSKSRMHNIAIEYTFIGSAPTYEEVSGEKDDEEILEERRCHCCDTARKA